MSNSIFDVTMVELPANLPVLPFSGAFLFPETKLNLRIYEMRYIRLVFNALLPGVCANLLAGFKQGVGRFFHLFNSD